MEPHSNAFLCRELLVIGGVAAKDQLSALEQGVSEIWFLIIK